MAKALMYVLVLLNFGIAEAKSLHKPIKIVKIEYDEPAPAKRDPRREIPLYSENKRAMAADARHQNRMRKILDLQIPE